MTFIVLYLDKKGFASPPTKFYMVVINTVVGIAVAPCWLLCVAHDYFYLKIDLPLLLLKAVNLD